MRMWDTSYNLQLLPVHSLLGKQHIKISGWYCATFILDIFGQFRKYLGEDAIEQNSDFQLQYKLNLLQKCSGIVSY